MNNLAWEVTINGEMTCIVFTTTAPKARWMAVNSFRSAGFGRPNQWPNVKAKRIPVFDDSPLRDRPGRRCWIPEYVSSYP